jgi:hypothetical protein
MNVFWFRTSTSPRRRRWEDRQLIAGHDPRVMVELQAILDRTESDRHADRVGAARSW